jgi:hypothetical protein
MSIVTRKAFRQKLMATAVLEKIDREHLSVDTERVRASLHIIRAHVTGTTKTECLDRWEQIIGSNDLDAVRRIVVSDDEIDREMRNLSPLTVLLSEPERIQVLAAVRDHVGNPDGRPPGKERGFPL